MNCQAWRELLQQHLDGSGPPGALQGHLHDCPDCAARRVEVTLLLDGLARLSRPELPAGLAGRLTARLCAEARARRVRAWRRVLPMAGLAAAATVLLALGLWSWRPVTGTPRGPRPGPAGPGVRRVQPEPARPALRDRVAEAGQAVASLGQRTASDTVNGTTTLLPLVRDPAIDPLKVPAPVEPPLEPLREAAGGVSSGLAPVADSARRAVNLFFRDLPVSRAAPGRENKPG